MLSQHEIMVISGMPFHKKLLRLKITCWSYFRGIRVQINQANEAKVV